MRVAHMRSLLLQLLLACLMRHRQLWLKLLREVCSLCRCGLLLLLMLLRQHVDLLLHLLLLLLQERGSIIVLSLCLRCSGR